LKLTSDDETLAENKVLILYILKNVNESLTNNNLYKIVLAVIDMNYFYFQQFLLDLIDNGYVMHYQTEDVTLYQITDKGRETLELTEDLLPGIIKLQVDTNLKGAVEQVSDEGSIIAEYVPKSENYYNITCKIVEKNETIFEIKTFAGSREQAKQIVNNWKSYAIQIYPKLIETLTTNYAELNPEINSENENLNNSDTAEQSTSSIQEDDKPVDGNINLFDSM
jgi:predicted transcriptional regulator